MIEQALMDYGVAGVFILYLIYDRQVLLRGVTKALVEITEALDAIPKKRRCK